MTGEPLTPEAARQRVLAEAARPAGEEVALAECLGRTTAAEIRSPIAIQPFDNSAMDGYALRSADTGGAGRTAKAPRPGGGDARQGGDAGAAGDAAQGGDAGGSGRGDAGAAGGATRLRLIGESRAGHPSPVAVGEGEAVWISTGAMVPAGADAVLPVEDSREEGGELLPGRPVRPGENVRRAGEDVEAGAALLAPGTQIGAAEVAVLAAAGVARVGCARRPRVAILGSGDELVPPGEPLGPGQIHDSNTHALSALVREAGADLVHVAHLSDDPASTREALAAALGPEPDRTRQPEPDARAPIEDALIPALREEGSFRRLRGVDILLVAGGVSVGRHDHVKGALAELGVEERFWRVAMRPGGPTWFGVLPREEGPPTLVFGLPGNPVSAMVTFHLFAKPALRAMLGLDPAATRTRAVLAAAYRKKPGKAHFLRCRLELIDGGRRAHLTREHQGSHVLTSMLGADGLAVIPAEAEAVGAGEPVEVELLR